MRTCFVKTTNFWLDVRQARRNETFVLTVREAIQEQLDFLAVNVQPWQRHLLLLARQLTASQPQKEKVLCGHDERHWFVAGVSAAGIANILIGLLSLED